MSILIITIIFWHIQRKYIREENPENDKFHERFRQWLDKKKSGLDVKEDILTAVQSWQVKAGNFFCRLFF